MRRTVLLLAVMAYAMVAASGAALADNIQGNGGNNRLVGTNGQDTISGSGGADDIFGSLNAAELARRSFREVARVAGLVFPGMPGQGKTAKQLQASANLFFQVFSEYDPGSLLLVQARREVLARHTRPEHRHGWSSAPRTSLRRAVVSALVEDPELFAQPLPPLRELLPLPEDLRPQDADLPYDRGRDLLPVEVPLSPRVHGELARRADLLAERLPDYLSLLLCAAADRLQPVSRYDAWRDAYDGPSAGDSVVRLDQWDW